MWNHDRNDDMRHGYVSWWRYLKFTVPNAFTVCDDTERQQYPNAWMVLRSTWLISSVAHTKTTHQINYQLKQKRQNEKKKNGMKAANYVCSSFFIQENGMKWQKKSRKTKRKKTKTSRNSSEGNNEWEWEKTTIEFLGIVVFGVERVLVLQFALISVWGENWNEIEPGNIEHLLTPFPLWSSFHLHWGAMVFFIFIFILTVSCALFRSRAVIRFPVVFVIVIVIVTVCMCMCVVTFLPIRQEAKKEQ